MHSSNFCHHYLCRLLSELESPPWWPFGKLPWKSQQDVKAEHAAREAACKGTGTGKHRVITSVPAIVSRGGDSDLKPGCLMVMVSSLEVRDTNYVLLHRFQRDEVDDIRVHNPYEISVRQRFIGKPDICFRLLSAKMPEAMSVLEMQYKKKVEYTSEYSAFMTTPATTPCDQDQGSIWNAGKKFRLLSVVPVRGSSLFILLCTIVCVWPPSGSKDLWVLAWHIVQYTSLKLL